MTSFWLSRPSLFRIYRRPYSTRQSLLGSVCESRLLLSRPSKNQIRVQPSWHPVATGRCGEHGTAARNFRLFSVFEKTAELSNEETDLDFEEAIKEEDNDNDNDDFHPTRLQKGTNEGFFVVQTYQTPTDEFDMELVQSIIEGKNMERLELSSQNLSVPVALMVLSPEEFPSMSRARKACRNANVLIHRGPISHNSTSGDVLLDTEKCIRARVGDRVYPGDVLGRQVRMGDGYSAVVPHQKPSFDLPVIYEDDHFAIVNKPAGVVVYGHRKGGHGIMTIRAGLPFAVTPPKSGTYSTLRRPQPVHRLDKPTSGLLLVAKTKPAMVQLSQQFRDRKVKKTYVAVLNGIPQEPLSSMISSSEAHAMGVDVEPSSKERGNSLITLWMKRAQ